MTSLEKITLVVSVNDREILNQNLTISPMLQAPCAHELLVQEGFKSAAKAYNDAIDRSKNDILVFVHQDMIFPANWFSDLKQSIELLDRSDPHWGVLGCYGRTQDCQDRGYVYSPDMGTIGQPLSRPEAVQTLDEIVLVMRKSSGLRFDDTLPHFHFYGADLCLSAADHNMKCYAISAFCIHNTQYNLTLPKEFYKCYRHVKRKWGKFLPICTSCITVTRFDKWLRLRRLNEFYRTNILKLKPKVTRVSDGRGLLQALENARRTQPGVPFGSWKEVPTKDAGKDSSPNDSQQCATS
jgi:hypothetical protein